MRHAAVALVCLLATTAPAAVPYDIVYVRQPRYGADTNTTWPEVFHPAQLDPGADLVLLHPDGSEEVLVAAGDGAVTDPFVSFDARWVYYSFFPDVRPEGYNSQRDLPYAGADIYRLNLETREVQQLTHGEFTPNTGAGHFDESNPLDPGPEYDRLGYGILNTAPCPLAGGRVAFTSNRNGFLPPKGYTNPTLQLFVMDEDGANVTPIAPMNVSSALHPTPLRDGRLMFSSHESQGLRDTRLWGLWAIWPDGRHWEPLVSAFHDAQAFHFQTQLGSGDIAVVDYYNLNNNGFGALFVATLAAAGGAPLLPGLSRRQPADRPDRRRRLLLPLPHAVHAARLHRDHAVHASAGRSRPVGASGVRAGKFTHPSAAPTTTLVV
jgi:hypothetical protein